MLRVISTQVIRQRQAQFYDELKQLEEQQGILAAAMKIARMAKLTGYLQKFNQTFDNWNRDKMNQGSIRLTYLAHDRVPGGFAKLLDLARTSRAAGIHSLHFGHRGVGRAVGRRARRRIGLGRGIGGRDYVAGLRAPVPIISPGDDCLRAQCVSDLGGIRIHGRVWGSR